MTIPRGRTTCGFAVVRPEEQLDHSTTPAFRKALEDVAGSGRVVIDLTGVEFTDPEGIGALAGAIHRSLDNGDRVVVACQRPSLLQVLHMSRIEQAVPVVPTMEEAATIVQRGGAGIPPGAQGEGRDIR